MNRFGSVRLIRNGDTEISEAIADGMMAQMAMNDEMRRRVQRSLMRVDIGRGGVSKQDYAEKISDAKLAYCQSAKAPNVFQRMGHAILGVYGLAVLAAKGYFNFSEPRWKGV